jgi:hypothetical protein
VETHVYAVEGMDRSIHLHGGDDGNIISSDTVYDRVVYFRQWYLEIFYLRQYLLGMLEIYFYEIADSKIECYIGELIENILAYADNMIVSAPFWRGLQQLNNIFV